MNATQLNIFDILADEPINKAVVTATKQINIEDFGSKIGGARKDLFNKKEGLVISDLSKMNAQEKEKYVRKDNIWPKPNYQELVDEGREKAAVFYMKLLRDAVPTKPRDEAVMISGLEKAQRDYVQVVDWLKSAVMNLKKVADMPSIKMKLYLSGYVELNGRFISTTDSGYSALDRKLIQMICNKNEDFVIRKMKATHFLEKKDNSTVKSADSNNRKKRYSLPKLDSIRSSGYDYRNGQDATPEQFLNELGFRAGEFGNWTNQEERQENLNHCYDSIKNLALALEITPKQLVHPSGVNEEALAIAFGSRGIAYSAAHYESLRHVINLTKMHGAGSLAHEMGHFIDNYISLATNGDKAFATHSSIKSPELEKLIAAMNTRTFSNEETIAARHAQVIKRVDEINRCLIVNCGRAVKSISKEEWKYAVKKYVDVCLSDSGWRQSGNPSNEFNNLVLNDSEGAGRWAKANFRYVSFHRYLLAIALREEQAAKDDHTICDTGKTEFLKDAERLNTEWCKFGHDYWTSNCEMFARAFACYIEDKLSEMGIVDDYLTAHADRDGCTKGEERKAINDAFDALFAKLKHNNFF